MEDEAPVDSVPVCEYVGVSVALCDAVRLVEGEPDSECEPDTEGEPEGDGEPDTDGVPDPEGLPEADAEDVVDGERLREWVPDCDVVLEDEGV